LEPRGLSAEKMSLGRPKWLEFAEQSAGEERASYAEREF